MLFSLVAVFSFLLWFAWYPHQAMPVLWSVLSAISMATVFIAGFRQRKKRRRRDAVASLVRFVPFYAGAALIAYICLQTLNPAFVYRSYGEYAIYAPVRAIEWLPQGYIRPGWFGNTTYYIQFAFLLWSGLVVLWAGIRTRRTLSLFVNVVSLQLFVWSALAIYLRMSGEPKVFWLLDKGYPGQFLGTYVNVNHSGYLAVLGTILAFYLLLDGILEYRKRLRYLGPHLLHVVVLVTHLAVVFLSGALGPGITAIGVMMVGLVFLMLAYWRQSRWLSIGAFAAGSVLSLLSGYLLLANPEIWQRIRGELERTEVAIQTPASEGRYHVSIAGTAMLKDRLWTGWGAGSFEVFHRSYLRQYAPVALFAQNSSIENPQTGKRERAIIPVIWRHAHNDWLEWLVELGVVGFAIGLLTPLALFGQLIRTGRGADWASGFMTLCLVAYAATFVIDFHMRTPVVAWLYLMMLGIVTKRQTLRFGQLVPAEGARVVRSGEAAV